jgi:hypothetical protein
MSGGGVSDPRHKNQGSEMLNPLNLALQGLQPGAAPIQIAMQGLTLTITPQPEPDEDERTFYVPMTWNAPRIQRDCVIEIQGCRATLSTTASNVADANPTTEELDILDDIAFAEVFNRRLEEEEEERAHARFMERFQQASQLRAERRAKREFRQSAVKLAEEIKCAPDAMEDLAALVLLLKVEISQLSSRIQDLESPQPKPAKRKK